MKKYDLLVVGELNVDVVFSGLKQAPVLGQEVLAEAYTECMGSSSGICACAAARLGLRTAFLGKLGTDARGEMVLRTLKTNGVHTENILQSADYETGVTVSMSMPEDRAMVTYFGDTINSLTPEEIDLESAAARHIHVGSYFLHTKLHGGLTAIFRKAHAMGMTTSLDAGWDETGGWKRSLGDVLTETDYFFPNEKEAMAIAGTNDVVRAARAIAEMGCNAVVKCGSDGAAICSPEGELLRAPAFRVKAVDTTGAGDSFNAGFLYARLHGLSMAQSMRFGNAVGAVSVCHKGGTSHCPTLEEAQAMLAEV